MAFQKANHVSTLGYAYLRFCIKTKALDFESSNISFKAFRKVMMLNSMTLLIALKQSNDFTGIRFYLKVW
ncbi:CLUMA_CG013127, isoform A [Clunio marinus]|uniref:CLUMA_CG013127, isoform A n=1 Tax=Clunio marinus TaxID=568069 RepID=A0A1J1IHX9_9DIPT|nr:CLUMA_CG013127, isoform A [Clunio marinus]